MMLIIGGTMSKCDGCLSKIQWENLDLDAYNSNPNSITHILDEHFNGGKWKSICCFTKPGDKSLKECPCFNCFVRPVCGTVCEELSIIIRKYGTYTKVRYSENSLYVIDRRTGERKVLV